MLYKIGDFSKETNVPIKTLRYYDEINLFKPYEIDLFTGYRYYDSSQISDLQLILRLKKIGFSLEEIKNNWNEFTNEIMLKKKEELLNEVSSTNENIREIDYLRSNIVNGKFVLENKKETKNEIKIKRIGDIK